MSAGPSFTTGVLGFATDKAEAHIRPVILCSDPNKAPVGDFFLEMKPIVIENIRGKEDSVALDSAGFQFVHWPAKHKDFKDDEPIKREYYPECIDLLKEATGGSRVIITDYKVRRHRLDGTLAGRQPSRAAHVDDTPKAAVQVMHKWLPASEVASALKRRYQIINIWRPISNPAFDWPITLCDYRTINPKKDVFAVPLETPAGTTEQFAVKYNENQRWKYIHGLTPDEVILIKCFDSIQDGSVACFSPHLAFKDPAAPQDSPLRESIEIRTLVLYD